MSLLNGRTYMAKCGHKTKKRDTISVFGNQEEIVMNVKKGGKIEFCHHCFEKMIIKCAWCGEPIFPDNPITLFTPNDKDFIVSEYAVIYNKDPLALVGCLRVNCADTGADKAGFWVSPGEVKRIPTAFERIINGEETVYIPDKRKT